MNKDMETYNENMEKVYLNLGIPAFGLDTEIINAHGLYYDCDDCKKPKEECNLDCLNNAHPTLKDVSIILHKMVGQGVIWQLASELSDRMDLNPYDVLHHIHNIISEYARLPAQEAIDRFHDAPKLHTDPRTGEWT